MNAATASSAEQRSYGIFIVSTGGNDIIEENTIAGINNASTNVGSTAVGAFSGGIGTQGSAGTIKVIKNFISGITCSGGTRSIGIRVISSISTTVENNVLSLNSNDNSVFYGINHVVGTAVNYYNNTVFIGGTVSADKESAAFYYEDRAQATNVSFNNNLMVNTRTGGTGNHYGYKNVEADATQMAYLQSNYNNYFVSGSANNILAYYNGADRTTIEALRTANGNKDLQSISLNPGFPSISFPTVPDDYRGSAAGLVAGTTISGLTTDYENSTRAATPTMGAFEFATVWNGSAWNVAPSTPSATYNAVINGTYSGAGFDCKDLIVNAGKQVTITSSNLLVAGNLLLKSDATNGTATFIDNGGTLSVGANKTFVQQYLSYGRNWYMSSPVSTATSNVVSASASKPLYYYVESSPNTWSSIINTSTALDVMTGYVANVANSGVVTFTGGSLNTGAVTPVSKTGLTRQEASFKGFNLIGNPYPSYVSWNNATLTNVGTSIWYRSKRTGSYAFQTYNRNGGQGTNGGTQYIPPMQSFWVQVSSGTGTVAFPNTSRSHQNQSVSDNRLKAPKASEQKVLRLQVSNNRMEDETVIYFDSNAADNFDSYDSQKLSNNSADVPEIFTVLEGNNLAINGLKKFIENAEYTLGFKTGQTNTFSIKATEFQNFDSGVSVILKDKVLNTETDLSDGTTYTFESGIANTTNRFSLVFRAPGVTTGVDDSKMLNVSVYVNSDNKINIQSPESISFRIYNALGQELNHGMSTESTTTINKSLNAGIYLVELNGKSGKEIRKVIIR